MIPATERPAGSRRCDRILVLGLGNDILTDDAVGLLVARAVAERLRDRPQIAVRETTEMGLALLDEIADFDALILVDAVQTGRVPQVTSTSATSPTCRRSPRRRRTSSAWARLWSLAAASAWPCRGGCA